MADQEEFFSPKHKRLLNIATWAKYLAWIVLIAYMLGAIGVYLQEETYFKFSGAASGQFMDFMEILTGNPMYGFSLFVEILNVFLNGIIYFLVLKGISLGLNMIVETDINYREQRQEGGAS